MMFLEHNSSVQNVWQQLKWKIHIHQSKMIALLFIQILFTLLLGGTSIQYEMDIGTISGTYYTPSVDLYAVASTIFIFIISLFTATRGNVAENYSIPTTRFLANVSNSLYLLFVSVVTAIVSYSSLYIVSTYQILLSAGDVLIHTADLFSLAHFIGFVCFMLFVSSAGYLLGCLFQIRTWLGALAVVVCWGALQIQLPFIEQLYLAIVQGGILLFILKCMLISVGLYAIAFVAVSNLEVG